jgi:tRNA threonylcarbamoyladenosine biosynthesis protein TsaB
VLILGIDTATDQVSAAIGGHEGVLGSVNVARGRRHAETLAPAIDFLRHQTGVGLDELGVVAVDVGPGLFTGLRVGVATAKAMAYALRIPMIGVPSLDLVAFPQRLTSRLIVAAIDARRGELFYAFYRSVPAGVQRVTPHQVGSPRDVASEIVASGEECLVVGDGARRYLDVFDGLSRVLVADQEVAHPTAAALVQLAHAQALREEFVKPWELEPLYLRKPDAVANWTSRTAGGTS